MKPRQRYKARFQNLERVARKVTSSIDIGDILEIIRDEAKATIPRAREVCLLVFDPEASNYTRPLHCGVFQDRLNCQLCKRGRETVQKAVQSPARFQCADYQDSDRCLHCSLAKKYGVRPSSSGAGGPAGKHADPEKDRRPCNIALPIYDNGKPLAVLEVIAREEQVFDELDVVLLEDLARLATNAIVNARRHWQMAREKLSLDQILDRLRPFVPQTVQRIVEKDPEEPFLGKRDEDVSLLFLDVAGYTRISEALTREKVNFIIEKYFSAFLDVIYQHGGDINETAGDGLMVIFMGPEQENALNAAQASLEIRRRTLEINEELAGRFLPLEVNMGINSGTVSLGMSRFEGKAGTRMTFTASGPATNLAARIAAAARNGDILAGPETARRIQAAVRVHDRGLMKFKNVRERVRVFSLLGPARPAREKAAAAAEPS